MNKLFKLIVSMLSVFAILTTNSFCAFAQTSMLEGEIPKVYSHESEIMPMSGEETLYSGNHSIGSFTLIGSNLTPIKTIGNSGNFSLYGTATSNSSSFCVRVQIREYPSGRVLTSTTTGNTYDGVAVYATPIIWLNAGQRIQIYMDYLTTPSQAATVSMNYTLG